MHKEDKDPIEAPGGNATPRPRVQVAPTTSLPTLLMESLTAVRNVLGINEHAVPIDSQEISLLWRVVNSITNLLSLSSSDEFTAMRARDVLILNLYRLARFRPDQTLLHLTLAERMDAEEGIGNPLSDKSQIRSRWEKKVYDSYYVHNIEDCLRIVELLEKKGFSASLSARDQRADHRLNLFRYLSEPALQKLEHLYHLRIGTLTHSLELEAPYLTAFNPTAGPAPNISALRANYFVPLEALILSDALTEPFSSHALEGCLRDLQRITSYVRIFILINVFLTPMNTLASLDLSTTPPAEVLEAFYTFGYGVLQDSNQRIYLKDLEERYSTFSFRPLIDIALTSLDLYQRKDTKDSFFTDTSEMIKELSALRPHMREIIVQETMCFLKIRDKVIQKPDKTEAKILTRVAQEGLSRVILSNLVETITPMFIKALRDKPISEARTNIQRRALVRAFWILGEGCHHLSETHRQRVATAQLWSELSDIRDLLKGKKEMVLSFFNEPKNESTVCSLLDVLDLLTQCFSDPQKYTKDEMETAMQTLAAFKKHIRKAKNDDPKPAVKVLRLKLDDNHVKNKVQKWMEVVPPTNKLSEELNNLKRIDPAKLTVEDSQMIQKSRFINADKKSLFKTVDQREQASQILSELNFQTYMEDQIDNLLVNNGFCKLLEEIEMHEQEGAFDKADNKEITLQEQVGDTLQKLFFPNDVVKVDCWISDIRECNGFPPQKMRQEKQLRRAIFIIERLSTKLDELKQFIFTCIATKLNLKNVAIDRFMEYIICWKHIIQLKGGKNTCFIQNCLRQYLFQNGTCMYLAMEDCLEDIRHFTDRRSMVVALETFGLQEPALAWFIQSQQEAFDTIGNCIAHLGNIVNFDTAIKKVQIDRIIRFCYSIFEDGQCGHSLLSALSQLRKCLESELGKPPKIPISFSTTIETTFSECGGGRHFTICSNFPQDADNGFSALGLTRAKAVQLLIEPSARHNRRACLAPDIKQALLGDYLPLSLKNERTGCLARQYHYLKAQLRAADQHFDGVELMQRTKLLKNNGLILLNDIDRFVMEENTYIQFVLNTCGYGWLTYPNTKGLLMLLGMMNNVNVHVWQQTSDNEVTLVTHAEFMYPSTTKRTALHLLHAGGGMRFERLVEGPVPQSVVGVPDPPVPQSVVAVPDPQNFMWFQIDMQRSGTHKRSIEFVPSCHSPLQLPIIVDPSGSVLVQQGILTVAKITIMSNDPECSGRIDAVTESSQSQYFRFADSIVFVFPQKSQPPSASGYVQPEQLCTIATDGNCMFDSVREGVMRCKSKQYTVLDLRMAVADYINDHIAEYKDRLIVQIVRDGPMCGFVGLIEQYVRTTLECERSGADNALVAQYVDIIRRNNTCMGGNVELHILSHIAGVQIVVHRRRDRRADPVINNTKDSAAPIVHLAYDGAHYNLYLTGHDQQNH